MLIVLYSIIQGGERQLWNDKVPYFSFGRKKNKRSLVLKDYVLLHCMRGHWMQKLLMLQTHLWSISDDCLLLYFATLHQMFLHFVTLHWKWPFAFCSLKLCVKNCFFLAFYNYASKVQQGWTRNSTRDCWDRTSGLKKYNIIQQNTNTNTPKDKKTTNTNYLVANNERTVSILQCQKIYIKNHTDDKKYKASIKMIRWPNSYRRVSTWSQERVSWW